MIDEDFEKLVEDFKQLVGSRVVLVFKDGFEMEAQLNHVGVSVLDGEGYILIDNGVSQTFRIKEFKSVRLAKSRN